MQPVAFASPQWTCVEGHCSRLILTGHKEEDAPVELCSSSPITIIGLMLCFL